MLPQSQLRDLPGANMATTLSDKKLNVTHQGMTLLMDRVLCWMTVFKAASTVFVLL